MMRSLTLVVLCYILVPGTTAQSWSPVGVGCGSAVYALEEFNDMLIVGGTFTQAGGVNAQYLARWDGAAWAPFGNLITYLAADGLFSDDTALYVGDGGRVRRWSTNGWYTYPGVFNSSLYSMAFFNDSLYVGGFFSSSNSVPYPRVARWNGSGYENLTSGCNAQVSDLLPFNGMLFVGGNFTIAGDSLVNHTALWDGQAWHRMGAGVNNDVFTHCLFQDTLYIGGRFTMANGQPASRVAKWNGSQWVRVGGTLNDFVTAMTVYRDQLYIGGAFTTPSHIARLSGATWVPVGSGCDNTVRTMEVYHDSLFVGGSFLNAGGQAANRIAKWYLPEAPVAGFSVELPTLCPNACTGFLDASSNGPTSYAWAFPGGLPSSSSDPTPFVCYPTPGMYDVSLTVANVTGSNSFTLTDAVTVETCTHIHGTPASPTLVLRAGTERGSFQLVRNVGPGTLRIYDPHGRELQVQPVTRDLVDLDVRGWSAGVYLISVTTKDARQVVRMVLP